MHLLEEKIALSDRLVRELEADISRRQEGLEQLKRDIGEAENDLESHRQAFYHRLRVLYKMRRIHPLGILLGSTSVSSALRNIAYLTCITKEDRRQVSRYLELTRDLQSAREERRKKLNEISARQDEVHREKNSLLGSEKEKKSLLATV